MEFCTGVDQYWACRDFCTYLRFQEQYFIKGSLAQFGLGVLGLKSLGFRV